jgi:phosphomannomutase
MVKKLIVFDLDGTLAESKSSIDTEMSALIHSLLSIVKVAVISGGDWLQFEKQVLSGLPIDKMLENLSIHPTCCTKFYRYYPARRSWFARQIRCLLWYGRQMNWRCTS